MPLTFNHMLNAMFKLCLNQKSEKHRQGMKRDLTSAKSAQYEAFGLPCQTLP